MPYTALSVKVHSGCTVAADAASVFNLPYYLLHHKYEAIIHHHEQLEKDLPTFLFAISRICINYLHPRAVGARRVTPS